jgi:hypothetical protein
LDLDSETLLLRTFAAPRPKLSTTSKSRASSSSSSSSSCDDSGTKTDFSEEESSVVADKAQRDDNDSEDGEASDVNRCIWKVENDLCLRIVKALHVVVLRMMRVVVTVVNTVIQDSVDESFMLQLRR